jgi:hypothetical protein
MESSIGILNNLIPKFSESLYQTIGSTKKLPVKTPLLKIKNGNTNK